MIRTIVVVRTKFIILVIILIQVLCFFVMLVEIHNLLIIFNFDVSYPIHQILLAYLLKI